MSIRGYLVEKFEIGEELFDLWNDIELADWLLEQDGSRIGMVDVCKGTIEDILHDDPSERTIEICNNIGN